MNFHLGTQGFREKALKAGSSREWAGGCSRQRVLLEQRLRGWSAESGSLVAKASIWPVSGAGIWRGTSRFRHQRAHCRLTSLDRKPCLSRAHLQPQPVPTR